VIDSFLRCRRHVLDLLAAQRLPSKLRLDPGGSGCDEVVPKSRDHCALHLLDLVEENDVVVDPLL
jgi:hypothetical protein